MALTPKHVISSLGINISASLFKRLPLALTEVYQSWLKLLKVSVSNFKSILAFKRFPPVNPVSLWAGLEHLQRL